MASLISILGLISLIDIPNSFLFSAGKTKDLKSILKTSGIAIPVITACCTDCYFTICAHNSMSIALR